MRDISVVKPMKKLVCLLLVFALIISVSAFSSCSDNGGKTADNSPTEEYDKLLKQFAFKGECYATADNKSVYNKGIAYSDEDKKLNNNENTIFFIASITKQFTASAIMLLQERNMLSVSDTLSKYFPEYKYAGKITIDNLLRMRSGIPDYLNKEQTEVFKENYNPYSHSAEDNRKVIRDYIFSQKLEFNPDTDFNYTNSGYFLLAEIIEKVSKTAYKDFLKKEIFDKLGMSSTGFIDDKLPENFALPYNIKDENEISYKIKGAAFGCGDMVSSAVDLTKWADGFRNCKIINKNSYKAMINPDKNKDYGCGLYITEDKKSVYHAGNYIPYKSSLLISLDDTDFTCVVLSNYNFIQVDYIAKSFKEFYDKR